MAIEKTPLSAKFAFYCQKVLPLVYDESLSYYEVLCKLAEYMNNMFATQEGFAKALEELGIRQDEVEKEFAELQETVNDNLDYMRDELDKVKNGDYISLYLDSIQSYLDQNMQKIVANTVKYVSFGITDDGRFCAYIPDTWDFLGFDTVPEGEPLAGHLVLYW
jgi:hypothetical protein